MAITKIRLASQAAIFSLSLMLICWTLCDKAEARSVRESRKSSKCPHLQNEGLHAVLDRVCEECFVMFRFVDPDVGAKCKKRCFKNDHYQWCAASLSNNELAYPDPIRTFES